MKKIGITFGLLIAALAVALGGYVLGANHGSQKQSNSGSYTLISSSITSNSSSSMSSSSQSGANPETSSNYDPNKTLNGQTVDSAMIQKVTEQLKAAGLPADQWAPSDIKAIITKASQQGISPVDYAKQNYHQ